MFKVSPSGSKREAVLKKMGCRHFHVTCAIDEDILSPASSIPPRYSARCGDHKETMAKEQREYSNGRGRSRRRRRINHSDDEEDESMDEEDENEDEDDGDDGDDDEEGSQSDDEVDLPHKNSGNASKNGIPVKRRATAAHSGKAGPTKLFLSDQSGSDDDMGTTSRKESKSSKGQSPKSHPPKPSATNSGSPSLQDRADPTIPKQLKTENLKKLTPPSSATSTSSVSSSLAFDIPKPSNGTPKQKLPSKSHLVHKRPENIMRKSSMPVKKELDEVRLFLTDRMD